MSRRGIPLYLAIALVTLTGCTSTAGPYVTKITNPGDGNLHVQRCTVEYSTFFGGSVSTGDCETELVPLK
jgi:hypothetical protein